MKSFLYVDKRRSTGMVVVVVVRSAFINRACCFAARAIAPADAVVGYANGAATPGACETTDGSKTSGCAQAGWVPERTKN